MKIDGKIGGSCGICRNCPPRNLHFSSFIWRTVAASAATVRRRRRCYFFSIDPLPALYFAILIIHNTISIWTSHLNFTIVFIIIVIKDCPAATPKIVFEFSIIPLITVWTIIYTISMSQIIFPLTFILYITIAPISYPI
jgi:hypothetical protein